MIPVSTPAAPESPRELADRHRLQFVDLRDVRLEREVTGAIPLHVLARAHAVPCRIDGDRLVVAIADPGAIEAVDDVRLASRQPVDFVVAPGAQIEAELRRLERGQEVNARAALIGDELPLEDGETDLEAEDGLSDAPPIRLVNSIIVQAVDEGASDVHFLPQADGLVARIRVDGVLEEVERIPLRHARGVVTRIKVLAKLDIAEHRLPQDGRLSLRSPKTGRLLDMRVAVLPTVDGEGVIMRLHDKTRRAPTLTEIGLSNGMQMALEEIVYRPTGAFLVTGPTGCGKSTTVYAALADLCRPEINVITVEDPVEYRLDDVYQVQIDNRAGLTFAAGLRSILRSDPDVLMVGEIRDLETAKIALEAALTGHSVLSTLHTNDAPSAITRLNELGVEPFVTGSAITAVLAQRLVRMLCEDCKTPYQPSTADLVALGFDPAVAAEGATLYRRRGCSKCSNGYRGRTGVYQLMVMDDELSKLTAAHASHVELTRAAEAAGMQTLWQDGLEKAAAGLTSIEELSRQIR